MDDSQPAQEEQRHTVLVIDDAEDVHRLLQARLRQENIELLEALGGQSGLDLAEEHVPSLILLDLDMPDMDGFEVLRHLKENSKTRDIPAIVLSGLQSPADKVIAFDLGAVDYVTKPFDLMELRVRLRSALRMKDLINMLGQMAHIDGLTGLWNRAHFNDRWAANVSENDRHGKALSVALFDLDHFKSINDTYGHPAGDAALQGFAKIVRREVRACDIACRYGGEEFALIMPSTSPEEAAVVCDRIRDEISKVQWPSHPERTITVSIGIAGATEGVEITPENWLEETDKALYRAKNGG
ncbi:MAG TPA: diguanylate cyclase, partial [Phycisphaerales bacterium]|nr:diguanylate cyclase [Phycisphaerales bacterium]